MNSAGILIDQRAGSGLVHKFRLHQNCFFSLPACFRDFQGCAAFDYFNYRFQVVFHDLCGLFMIFLARRFINRSGVFLIVLASTWVASIVKSYFTLT
ncbi:hypothetical protein ACIZ62_18450 [Acetobacterium carbinolicum]|uniref:hypothetical protein n=1 Tax=Acetobacterium carbinolicum TaxID=52690 RepID=UPI0039BFA876